MKNCYASPYGYNQNKGTLEQINDNEYKVIPNNINARVITIVNNILIIFLNSISSTPNL